MITIKINDVDVTSRIEQSVQVTQKIGNQASSAVFSFKKAGDNSLAPEYDDEVAIYDGSQKIFGGTVLSAQTEPMSGAGGVYYDVRCVGWRYSIDKKLVSRTYEGQTISYIINDLVASFAFGFTANVISDFIVTKIVFNQVSFSSCIQKLADIVNYEWNVGEDKVLNFFNTYTEAAPFELTDDNGNYVYKTLKRTIDGSQVANRVKVRGAEYNGASFTDTITVSGNDTKSFKLPYKFADLQVWLDVGAGYVEQNVGLDNEDTFATDDVLFNYQEKMIKFENNLADGNRVKFTGNPKTPVFVIAEDSISVNNRRQKYFEIYGEEAPEGYGVIEKLIKDTSITSNIVARRRATAELYAYSEPVIDAKFKTYTGGLSCGMSINLQSDIQSIDDQLMIKEIQYRMRDHDNFEYNISLISARRYDFIGLLQKILEPEATPIDDNEVSEESFSDTAQITISELTSSISPQENNDEVEIADEYIIDALGPDTNAIYVLGPYLPTDVYDTKRPGRLGISFALA